MTELDLICRDEKRRNEIRETNLNGLDYLEVMSKDQRSLRVYFLGRAPINIKKENIIIEGGRRIRDIKVTDCELTIQDEHPELNDYVDIIVDPTGDFSVYTLRLVDLEGGKPTKKPMKNFDPRYASLDFSFKAGCPSDLDCKALKISPPLNLDEPEIDYLAKDYASFRQTILDRLALILPDWKERHTPDLGIALVEILAYCGDYLSYHQDAVATEAYLNTARQRLSVRRHVRLVDYNMHEGCNARTLVFLETDSDHQLPLEDIYFITNYNSGSTVTGNILSREDLVDVSTTSYEVFEPLAVKGYLLHINDLRDPALLACKLRDAGKKHNKDQVSQYLLGKSSSEMRALLNTYSSGYPSEALQSAMVNGFNLLIRDVNLFDEDLFTPLPPATSPVKLRDETRKLIDQNPKGDDLLCLNRKLIEDSYPDEIGKMGMLYLYKAHNTIPLYTWGDEECCLPKGATSATLKSENLNLRVGDILILEEVKGPITGNEADADPSHRHAIRLTKMTPGVDPINKQQIVDIEWSVQDAIPFTLYISAIGKAPECEFIDGITVARGNIILIDHGRTVEEDIGTVQAKDEARTCLGKGLPNEIVITPSLFRPSLSKAPLTFSQPLEAEISATSLLIQEPRLALPQIKLMGIPAMPSSSTTLFSPDDLKDPTDLASRLKKSSDPVSRYLLRLLPDLYVFSWDEIPEKNKEILIEFLTQNFGTDWVKIEKIEKIDNGKTIKVFTDKNLILLKLNDIKTEVILEINDGRTYKLIAKTEKGHLNIYRDFNCWDGSQLPNELKKTLIDDLSSLIQVWVPKSDLLSSQSLDNHFTVEMDNDGFAHLRFGDGELGRMPEAGMEFIATYRLGNGPSGSIGSEMISYVVSRRGPISGLKLRPRNPFSAVGGYSPEKMEDVKLLAPYAFRKKLQRAVTAEDYASLAEGHSGVQRAAAVIRWTGSWHEVMVAIDPLGSVEADQELIDDIEAYLFKYKCMGHELVVKPAHYVPLSIEMTICVLPDYIRGHVEAELIDIFSNRVLADGRLGFFHPDRLTFGEGVYLSRLVAEAQAVSGVESVIVTKLERLFESPNHEIEKGVLPLDPLEIARLDNDPNFPENGQLTLKVHGGR